jgi:hypothetical protein
MIFRVYGVEAALVAVRVPAASRVEGSTFGKAPRTASPRRADRHGGASDPLPAYPGGRDPRQRDGGADGEHDGGRAVADRQRPGEERDGEDGGGQSEPHGEAAGAVPDVAGGLQGDEDGAVGEEQRRGGGAAEQGVRVEQVEQAADVLVIGVQWYAAQDVGERHAPQDRRYQRTDEDRRVPAALPLRLGALVPVLEGDAAGDLGEQDQQQWQVEAGEEGGVPVGEGGEDGAAGGDQPDLVAVPDRADGVDQDAPFPVVAAEDGQQHADAEVEAFEDEVAGEEHGDEQKPDGGEVHGGLRCQ